MANVQGARKDLRSLGRKYNTRICNAATDERDQDREHLGKSGSTHRKLYERFISKLLLDPHRW